METKMTERIRFCWLLPLVMTVAQLVLFVVTAVQERSETRHSALLVPSFQAAAIQEEEGTVTFEPMTPIAPRGTVKAALILNCPAMLGGVLLGGTFNKESDSSIIGFSVLFVPLVWYAIGNWVDRQVAGIGATPRRTAGSVAKWVLRVPGDFWPARNTVLIPRRLGRARQFLLYSTRTLEHVVSLLLILGRAAVAPA